MPTRSISSNGPIGKPAARIAPSMPVDRRVTLGQDRERLEGERPVDPIDDEARRVAAAHRRSCPRPSTIAAARSTTAGGCVDAATTSTSGMHRCGVEEVQPDDPTRPGRRLGDRGDRQGARVRGQDGVGEDDGIERAEDRPLHLEVLERRLDDEAWSSARRGGRASRRPPAGRGVLRPRCPPTPDRGPARGPSVKACPDARPSSLDRRGVDVVQDDLVPGLERDLGDPGAHRARPDDADDDRARRWCGHQTGFIASNGWRQSRQ